MPCSSHEYDNPRAVACPCDGCDGTLMSDGRNVADTRTFLQCSSCGCAYVADDFAKPPDGCP